MIPTLMIQFALKELWSTEAFKHCAYKYFVSSAGLAFQF